jgi:integrase
MATIFKKTSGKPTPEGAEFLTRKGTRIARWRDRQGLVRTAPLSPDGTRVLIDRPAWYIVYADAAGRRVTKRGYRDREATEALAQKLERDVARARQGLAPATDPALAQTPWPRALDLWLAGLRHDNSDDVYVANMRRLVTKVAEGCGWITLASVRPDRVRDWLLDIKANGVPAKDGRRKNKHPSDRTVDQYLEVAKRFLSWCCAQNPPYLEANPLESLKKIQKPKRVRRRRAISDESLKRLLSVSGPRSPVYRIAALTGLRKDELRQLQWRDIRLDHAKPSVHLRPEANKSRRDDRVPLNHEAVEVLTSLRPEDAGPLDPVFPSLPTLDTLKRDLEKAGIPYRDAEGRQFDFHSFRYCFCTMLARADVPIRTAIELMRHKDPKLTLQIYTDAGQLDTEAAVGRLPRLGPAWSSPSRTPGLVA